MTRLLLAFGILLGSHVAHAQNLILNGDFDNDISGWLNAGGSAWSMEDRDGNPLSGSVEIPISANASTFATIWWCFPASEGNEYAYGASFFIPPGGTPGVTTQVAVQWWDNPTCDFGGTPTGGTANTALETAGSWVDVQGSDVAPTSTQAGLMRIGYATPASGTSGTEVIRYDQVFVPEPSGRISAGSTLLVLGALGLAASRKTSRVHEAIPIRRSLPFRTGTRPGAAATSGFVPEAGS